MQREQRLMDIQTRLYDAHVDLVAASIESERVNNQESVIGTDELEQAHVALTAACDAMEEIEAELHQFIREEFEAIQNERA